jgi:4,4'-diaponeurosporenoate glycosyltransferase
MDFSLTVLLIHAVLWALGFLFLFRVPVPRPYRGFAQPAPTISVIIPARNEAHNVPALLVSLKNQAGLEKPEVIVVDDESWDGTARVAEENGASVVRVEHKPEGWAGKNWACQQGAEAARGELLIFLDADTRFETGGLRAIVETWQNGGGVVSVQPYHAMRRLYEQLSAYFNLVLAAALGAFSVFRGRLRPAGLFGPCLVLAKADYFGVGGHGEVKGRLMEDMFIAETFQKRGLGIRLFGGKGAISFRMYPGGIRELWDGWAKGFATGAARTSVPLLLLVVSWIVGSAGTTRELIGSALAGNLLAAGLWGVLYCAFAVQIYWMLRRLGNFGWYTALFYPLPFLWFVVVFVRSLILVFGRRRANWKGRSVPT